MGWADVGGNGGHGGRVQSPWSVGGRAWAEADCGELNALLGCYLPPLSPQEC